MSGRGGRRSTTWKNNWKHGGKTKQIRVPEALASQIMEYAVALDSGNAHHVSQEELQKTFLLTIDSFVEQRLEKFHPNQYSCIPSDKTRRWDELRKLRNLIAQEPNKILAPTINPQAPTINSLAPSINPLAPNINPLAPNINPLAPNINPLAPTIS